MNKLLLNILIGLVVMGAGVIVLQIWGVSFGDIFFKLLGTIGVLILLVGFLMVVKLDFSEHKRLKDQNYID